MRWVMDILSTVSLEDPRFIIMGYAFTGWNTKEDGSGTSYASHEKVQNLTSQDEDTITLYAQWEKETYTITYDLNGGVEGGKNPTTYDIDSETIFLADPIRDGYTFIGWLLVDENTYISSINTNWHHRNLKLQAQWEDTLVVVQIQRLLVVILKRFMKDMNISLLHYILQLYYQARQR